MSRRGRAPSDEEAALWEAVARSVDPLHPRRRRPEKPPADEVQSAKKKPPKAHREKNAPPPPSPPKPKPPPALVPIDRRTITRLGRGAIAINARIDLHGMTQQAAHHRLIDFLRGAQSGGAKLVLVITGKGREEGGEGRGVLRRVVPQWLSSPELRGVIVGFDEAGRAHGGSGALYVRLRRKR
jgi:DNA-nicking Smr family endonuclease